MSLRGKIVVLFLTLAILPLLGVAGFGYLQARTLAEGMVAQSLDSSAETLAQDLDLDASSIRGVLN